MWVKKNHTLVNLDNATEIEISEANQLAFISTAGQGVTTWISFESYLEVKAAFDLIIERLNSENEYVDVIDLDKDV